MGATAKHWWLGGTDTTPSLGEQPQPRHPQPRHGQPRRTTWATRRQASAPSSLLTGTVVAPRACGSAGRGLTPGDRNAQACTRRRSRPTAKAATILAMARSPWRKPVGGRRESKRNRSSRRARRNPTAAADRRVVRAPTSAFVDHQSASGVPVATDETGIDETEAR
jgi:hypothetical protein